MALLIFWWMLVIWAVLIVAYVLYRYWRSVKHHIESKGSDTPVAHSSRLTNLPEYINAFRQYRLLLRWAAGLIAVALLSAIIITARPALIAIVNPVQKNRDIMLCLDASGSVLKADAALINRFSALTDNFKDQRFGLTLFNSSAVTVIPLNDNYQLISQQLKNAGQAFQAQKGDLFTNMTNGTLAGFETGTSLTSDGLATCIQRMGANPQQRSQSIVLASDNEVNGSPVVGMTQAIAMAKQRGIHVFVIDPGTSDPKKAGDHSQLKLVAEQTEGAYFNMNDGNAINDLIDSISRQSTVKYVGLPQPAINDTPQLFIYLAALATIAAVVLLWRLEI